MLGLSEALGGLQGLRILECLHPAFGSMPLWKEKLAEFPLLVILEEMGHLGKSEDLFLKKSDSIL